MRKIVFFLLLIFLVSTIWAQNILVISASYGRTRNANNYSVFPKQAGYRGHEAHRIMQINQQNISHVTLNMTAYNGGSNYSDVIFTINNNRYVAISRLAPYRTGSGSISIPASILTYGQQLRVVAFVDNFSPSCWVRANLKVTGSNFNPPYNPPYNPPTPNPGYNKVNINTANPNQLAAIPGIGITRARAIVDWRYRYGNFSSINQLASVPGFTMELVNRISPYITLYGNGGYNPPDSTPTYDVNDVIRRADNASTYREGDRILLDAAQRMRSLRNILKLASHAYYRTTSDNILSVADRYPMGSLTDIPSFSEIKSYYDQYSSYNSADNMLKSIKAHISNATLLLRLAVMANYRETSKQILLHVKRNYRSMSNYPTPDRAVHIANRASNYQIEDDILITVSPMMRNYYDFDKLIDAATYSSTRKQIRQIRDQMFGNGNYGYNYNGHSSIPRRSENISEEINSKKAEVYTFTKEDISNVNKLYYNGIPEISIDSIKTMPLNDISSFAKAYKENKIKKSTRTLKAISKLKVRLNALKLSGQEENVSEILNNLK